LTAVLTLAATAALSVATLALARVGEAPPIDTLMASLFKFDKSQIEEVRHGRPVAVSLPGSMDREFVAGGAVRIEAPLERLLDRFRDIERLERGRGFLQTRRLSNPPVVDDFASLSLPDDDVQDLRSCRVGDCDLKLNQRGFDLFAGVDWKAPNHAEEVQRLWRQFAFELVESYRTRGNAGLGLSLEHKPPRDTAGEFADLIAGKPFVDVATPGLGEYLLGYPDGPRPAGLEEFFYWSIVEFGLKKTVRLNHMVIYPIEGTGRSRWVLANRILYASHYFQNAIELRMAADAPSSPGRAHYLLVLNLARPDGVTGVFGPLVRYKVRNGGRDTLRKTMLITKERTEAANGVNKTGGGS
jgi:hypothetical protein